MVGSGDCVWSCSHASRELLTRLPAPKPRRPQKNAAPVELAAEEIMKPVLCTCSGYTSPVHPAVTWTRLWLIYLARRENSIRMISIFTHDHAKYI